MLATLASVQAAVAAPPDLLAAERSPAALARLSIEELADLQISTVSKRPQRLADAAAAVYVITRDQIRQSGVAGLPEALRLAPNLQVARVSASSYAISARGFNDASANKLLVMIDGRSVYTPLHSGVFWDVQDVPLSDIERIEVVSGPGGTLWGANAVNGVINIVTRSARDTLGSSANLLAGNDERGLTLRHGLALAGDAALRLYAKQLRRDPSQREDGSTLNDAWERTQAGFRADGGSPASAWALEGDLYDGSADVQSQPQRRVSGGNLLGRWTRESVQIQLYLDSYKRRQTGFFNEDLDTVDLDVQHQVAWRAGHELVWGGGVRRQHDRTETGSLLAFVPVDSQLTLANVFAQDTISLSERVKLTLGLKAEHNSYTGIEYQPNVRIAWKHDGQSLMWAALSRAVRTPSRLDRDFHVLVNLGPPYNGRLLGGPSFQAERLTAWELGYRAQPTVTTSFSVNVFRHDYTRLRSIEPDGNGDLVLGNGVQGRTTGLEAWASQQVDEGWRLHAGLSLLNKRLSFAPGSRDPGSPDISGNDPCHQFMLRSGWSLPHGLSLDLGLRSIGALPSPAVPGYTVVDARLAWAPRRDVELSLAGFNLFDRRHVEFGAGPDRSAFGRNVLLRLLWRQ
ncbi:MAG TPA: TonB-dependent receptor [Albitalea sp.]|uniref:TonB-dependent receptor plug domain-containing protein n=1 Tax=Piscinibacter sp. TaxID=1903157 RepID=UPI002ED15BE7